MKTEEFTVRKITNGYLLIYTEYINAVSPMFVASSRKYEVFFPTIEALNDYVKTNLSR